MRESGEPSVQGIERAVVRGRVERAEGWVIV